MTATIIQYDAYPTRPWRNGLGLSMEIASAPGGDHAPWRFGIASIDRSCPFSIYQGYDRTILPFAGEGFVLTFPGGESEPLRVVDPLLPVPFDGAWPSECALLNGPVRDVNVMTERSAFSHRVSILSLTETPVDCPMASPVEGALCLILALRGSLTVTGGEQAMTIPEHATLRLEGASPTPPRLASVGPAAVAYVVSILAVA